MSDIDVRVLGIPLRLHALATEHNEELQREFALMRGSESVDNTSVPARLLQLIGQLTVRFGAASDAPRRIIDEAIERGDTSVDVIYRVPTEVAEACTALAAMLAEADAYCEQGEHLLTLATPPDVRLYREWFLGQFVVQVEGHPPQSWESWTSARAPELRIS